MTAPVRFHQVGNLTAGNRLLPENFQSLQGNRLRLNSLDSGHRACRGCGEALGARWVLDAAYNATGGKLFVVNATGCLEVFSSPYPESSWQLPWLHSLFGNAAAVATGVAAALKAHHDDETRVVAQAGDGGTVDIGFGCLSGMFERNDDVLFVCYDNGGYMTAISVYFHLQDRHDCTAAGGQHIVDVLLASFQFCFFFLNLDQE